MTQEIPQTRKDEYGFDTDQNQDQIELDGIEQYRDQFQVLLGTEERERTYRETQRDLYQEFREDEEIGFSDQMSLAYLMLTGRDRRAYDYLEEVYETEHVAEAKPRYFDTEDMLEEVESE